MIMESYDLYVLGSLDSAEDKMATEKLHVRFEGEERAFDRVAASQEGFKRVIDALLHGKVLVDYLVSTHGGNLTHWVRTGNVFALIQQNGGLVRTYALEKAFSLGAINWSMGDERFACEYTRFMWHLPQFLGVQPEPFDERSFKITESIRSHTAGFFESISGGAPWAEQVRELKDQDELRPSVADLKGAGFIDGLFKYPRDVKRHISDGTPWQFSSEDNETFLGDQLWYELSSSSR